MKNQLFDTYSNIPTDDLLQLLSSIVALNDPHNKLEIGVLNEILRKRDLSNNQLTSLKALQVEEVNVSNPNIKTDDQIESKNTERVVTYDITDNSDESFFKRNKIVLIISIFSILSLGILYSFFSQNIESLATKVADKYCEYNKSKSIKGIELYSEFLKNLDSNHDIDQLQSNINSIGENVETLMIPADALKIEIQSKITNAEKLSQFNTLLNKKIQSCNDPNYERYVKTSSECLNRLAILQLQQKATKVEIFKLAVDIRDLDFGSLIVEKQGINVRAEPNITTDVLFQLPMGAELQFSSEQIDNRGVYWYFVSNSKHKEGWVSGIVTNLVGLNATVMKPQTYFYDWEEDTNATKIRRQYLEMNDEFPILKRINGFVYTEFANGRGLTTKGWLKMDDIKVN